MTEVEVLKKLEEFKNAIISLKKKHAEEIEQITLQNNIVEEGLKKQLKEQEELLSKRILELQKTEGSLTDNINKADEVYATLAKKYNDLFKRSQELEEKNKVLETSIENWKKRYEEAVSELGEKKYSEEDLKELLKKASEKAKEKIDTLTIAVNNYEKDYSELSEKYSNLEMTNKSLENKLKETQAIEEIDQVLSGKITNSEIDQVLKQTNVIHPAEEQIEEMIDKKTRVVKMKV